VTELSGSDFSPQESLSSLSWLLLVLFR